MVSIADVAARAGVSQTTVSHTLSGKRAVSPQVQARVRAAMAELGYRPRRTAQNLAEGRTRLVGLIVPDISNSFFAELAKGIEEAAIRAEYNLVLCNSGFNHEREVLYLETIQSRAVDGVVYATGAPPTDSELASLLGDLPLVLVDEEVPGARAPLFVSDNEKGGRLVAEHLRALGHTRAAVISTQGLVSAQNRTDGFVRTWREAGCPPPVVVDGGFTYDGGVAAAGELLEAVRRERITAVFATNDLMALGAVARFEQAGLGCPADVSIVGFDDIAFAGLVRPRLTTVRQDVAQLGQQAARALIDALEEKKPLTPTRRVFAVELHVRESSGPPARS